MRNLDIISAIIGLAVGDALGVPAEFKTREYLKEHQIRDMIGFGTYNEPEGTWSDDTSMTLATMDAIADSNGIDTHAIADNFIKWYRNAEYTATDRVFDIGRATFQAMSKYELKTAEPTQCGGDGIYDNGNGSLMRIMPVAFYIFYMNIKDDREILKIVKDVSSITHRHDISIMGCYIYVRFVLELLNGNDKKQAYENIKNLDYGSFDNETVEVYSRILNQDISKLSVDEIKSSGYIVDTLEASIWGFLNSNNYDDAILQAVNLGEDTDTVAACTGGLLGLYYGIDAINKKWLEKLKKYDYIKSLCEKFENQLF